MPDHILDYMHIVLELLLIKQTIVIAWFMDFLKWGTHALHRIMLQLHRALYSQTDMHVLRARVPYYILQIWSKDQTMCLWLCILIEQWFLNATVLGTNSRFHQLEFKVYDKEFRNSCLSILALRWEIWRVRAFSTVVLLLQWNFI